MSRKFDQKDDSFESGSYKKHESKTVEKLALELELIDTFMKNYGTLDFESSEIQQLLKKTPIFRERGRNYDNDWKYAFSEAKAEVAMHDRLMKQKQSVLQNMDILIKYIISPAILILLTFLLGTIVGNILQESSFKRRQVFELKLEHLKTGRDEAADITAKLKELYLEIAAHEKKYANDINKGIKSGNEKDWGQRRFLELLLYQYNKLGKLFSKSAHLKDVRGRKVKTAIGIALVKLKKDFIDELKAGGFRDVTGIAKLKNSSKKVNFKKKFYTFFAPFEDVVAAYSEAILHALDKT